MSGSEGTQRGWTRRSRHVALRAGMLGGAYLAWAAVAWMLVAVHSGSSTAVSSGTGRPTTVVRSSPTLYQEQPATIRVILVALAVAVVVSTASVLWRVARRSERLGVAGLIAAGPVAAATVLGAMTIGRFLLPLATLLVLLALPIAPERTPTPARPGGAPPGWYGDPDGDASWRYWDGWYWTVHTAPRTGPA